MLAKNTSVDEDTTQIDDEIEYESENSDSHNTEDANETQKKFKILDSIGNDGKPYGEVWGSARTIDDEIFNFHFLVERTQQVIPSLEAEIVPSGVTDLNSLRKLSSKEFVEKNFTEEVTDEQNIDHKSKLFLASEDYIDDITENLLGEKNSQLRDVLKDYFSEILSDPPQNYWAKGRIHFSETNSEKSSDEDDEDDDEDDQGSSQQQVELPSDIDVSKLPKVSVLTSAIKGEPITKINEGESIQVRLKGSIVEMLPDSKKEDNRPNVSKPYNATVVKKTPQSEEENSEHNADSNLWKLIVEVNNGEYAKGQVSELERVVTKRGKEANDNSSDESMDLNSSNLLIVFGAILFFVILIFMILL